MKNRPTATPAAFYSDNSLVKVKPVEIPSFLVQVFLGKYSPDRDDFKSISHEKAYKHLLELGRLARKNGASQMEVLVLIWMRNLERVLNPLSEEALKELSARAMFDHSDFDIPDYETITIGDWKLVPGDLRLYLKEKSIQLHLHQIWVIEILNKKQEQGHPGMQSGDIVQYLNEKHPKRARDLHNWAFKTGREGDVLIGKNRLINTGGRGGTSYVTLNWDWNPLEDQDPRVQKIFSPD